MCTRGYRDRLIFGFVESHQSIQQKKYADKMDPKNGHANWSIVGLKFGRHINMLGRFFFPQSSEAMSSGVVPHFQTIPT